MNWDSSMIAEVSVEVILVLELILTSVVGGRVSIDWERSVGTVSIFIVITVERHVSTFVVARVIVASRGVRGESVVDNVMEGMTVIDVLMRFNCLVMDRHFISSLVNEVVLHRVNDWLMNRGGLNSMVRKRSNCTIISITISVVLFFSANKSSNGCKGEGSHIISGILLLL